jgi:hypothetical protein
MTAVSNACWNAAADRDDRASSTIVPESTPFSIALHAPELALDAAAVLSLDDAAVLSLCHGARDRRSRRFDPGALAQVSEILAPS